MESALGALRPAMGDGLGEIDEIIGISISDRTDHEPKQQDRGNDQTPVTACAGSARIIHLGLPDALALLRCRIFGWNTALHPAFARAGILLKML
jgi:hypothetical protein